MRLPKALLDQIKDQAKVAGVPYQRLIRATLEASLPRKSRAKGKAAA
jgi:predicted DNA binding CopG/RHH family protein